MSDTLKVGDLAYVIERPGILPNRVRTEPEIDVNNREHNVIGKIPENAVLAILPGPIRWPAAYPYYDGVYTWFRVRGRTDKKELDGRFKIVEGWTAVSEQGTAYLQRLNPNQTCQDSMGNSLDTHLGNGILAYVLPDVLNFRSDAGTGPMQVIRKRLPAGTQVLVTGGPLCVEGMVWCQVQLNGSSNEEGWVSESHRPDEYGGVKEWFLAPS